MTRTATVLAPAGAAPPACEPSRRQGSTHAAGAREARRRGVRPYLRAFALYEAVSLVVWWHLLAQGPATALPAGSADPGQEVWFLAWLPHALGAGLDPFFGHAIFFPHGVNLLDNTSTELLGLLLAPLTVTAGPIASLDVAVMLAPALSALGAFALCRRHVSWSPAAFAGGLCYGFGPFLTGDLRYAHLDLTWLVLPPLIFCALDELLVRGTRRPVLTGGVLGTLVVAQFFISTEMLAITVLVAAAAAVVVAAGCPKAVVPHVAAAWRGLAVAAGVVGAALAYPFWVVVDGPRRVAGPVWHHVGAIATALGATVEPHGQLAAVSFVSGSNGSYLGIALLAVLLVGGGLLWRLPVVRVALLTAIVAFVASLGYQLHVAHRAFQFPLPAAVLGHVALLDSIAPERFAAAVDLFCGLALAVILDRVREWERAPGAGQPQVAGATDGAAARAWPTARLRLALALSIGAFALVPFAALGRWPYEASRSTQPPGLLQAARSASAHGGPAPDFAIYPDTASWVSREMVWQAQDGFSFTLPDGYAIVPGPARSAVESPRPDALWLVFAAGAVHRLHLPLARTTRAAVRADLRSIGVDDVIVLAGADGSGAVQRALRETLGPPDRLGGGATSWNVQPATR